jgi:hypothetical protein
MVEGSFSRYNLETDELGQAPFQLQWPTNHGLQRRPRVDDFEVESRSRGPAEPYRSAN